MVTALKNALVLVLFWGCGQLSTSAGSDTSSPPPHWISTSVPLFYVIILAVLLLIVLASCIICIICTRRRHNQEYFTSRVEETSFTKDLTGHADSANPSGSGNNQLVPKDEHVDETPKTHTDEQEEGVKDVKTYGTVRIVTVSVPPEEEATKVREANENQDAASKDDNGSDKTTTKCKEPVYAEVKKPKEKQTNRDPTTVVYAELVAMENNHDACTVGTRQTTDYAEITRLDQSPREMTPLEE